MQAQRKTRLAADVEIDPVALAAAHAQEIILPVVATEELFPALTRHVPMPKFRPGEPTDPEEWQIWNQARLDRERWTQYDGEREYATAEAERMLQNDSIGKVDSGGGGGGSDRKLKFKPTYRPITDEGNLGMNSHLPRFTIVGLTPGEFDFYFRRPGHAESVLRQHVARILAQGFAPESFRHRRQIVRMRARFSVFLSESDIQVLKLHPGSARMALIQYAREIEGSHIDDVDRKKERKEA